MTDLEINSLLKRLQDCGKSSYYIAKKTGLSNSTLANWLTGKTKPTPANIAILEHFLSEQESSVIQAGDGVNINGVNSGSIVNDHRHYTSDSPDVLRQDIARLETIIAEKEDRIKEKDAQIKEKDAQIKEKDAQIKEKDAQINKLLDILKAK